MQKTTIEMCRNCEYGTVVSKTRTPQCNYYLVTKKRRGCPVGYCDKYEKRSIDHAKLVQGIFTY